MASLSTHVLDTSTGRPAEGVRVALEAADGTVLASGVTDADGRIGDLAADLAHGDHRLRFDTGSWFAGRGVDACDPEDVVAITITADEHHHVPLHLNPCGYATSRGS